MAERTAKNSRRLASPGSLHRASVCALIQGIERVGVKKLAELTELLVVVDADRDIMCHKLHYCVEMFASTKLSFSLVVQERIKSSTNNTVRKVATRPVVSAHDVTLSSPRQIACVFL